MRTARSYHGDIARFLAGDPTAGAFMTGFFPIMMFALPAAALAIWQEASPEQRKVVGGIMLSAALTSFLTGVTEPLEFAFMFVAWPLYVIHAVLTGTSMALVNALGIQDGFGFSAGCHRLRAELRNIATQAAAARPDRPRLRRGLLLRVPVRDPAVEPAHAGPRRGRRAQPGERGRGPHLGVGYLRCHPGRAVRCQWRSGTSGQFVR